MSLNYTPTTIEEAVNELLQSIGEARIATLEGTLSRDAERAVQYIHAASREVQTSGWSWNTDFEFSLAPDDAGIVYVPPDALRFNNVEPITAVARGPVFYDNTAHTIVFASAITADVVRFLEFDFLPENARSLVFKLALRRFQLFTLADESLSRYSAEDVQMAWADLHNEEDDGADRPNALTDNQTSTRILRARR